MRSVLRFALVGAAMFYAGGAFAQDIVIGGALCLSGPVAAYGEDAKIGMDLAVEKINAGGGVLGRKLRVEYEDTGADRAKAVAVYRKFGARPEIVADFVVSSIELVALDPVTTEVKLPMIVTGSSLPKPQFSPYAFRVSTPTDKVFTNLLAQLKKAKGLKTISILYDNANNGTVGEMGAAKEAAAALGITVKGVEAYTTNDQNFSLQLTNIAAQNPDLLYIAGTTNEAALILSQAKAIGLKSAILGGAGLNDPRIAALEEASRGVMTYFALDPKDKSPLIQDFVSAFQAKFKKGSPPSYAANAYDAVLLLADAIKRAGSTDREKVREALGSTEKFIGVNGEYAFKVSGDNLRPSSHIFVYTANGFERLSN